MIRACSFNVHSKMAARCSLFTLKEHNIRCQNGTLWLFTSNLNIFYLLSNIFQCTEFTKGPAYCALHCYVYKTITVRMEMGWVAAIKWANKNKWSLVKLLPGMASGFLLQFMIKYVILAHTKLPMDFIHL